MSETLSPRVRAFIEAFVRYGGMKKAQAAIDAGYAENSAHVTANRLLKMAKVREAIDARMKPLYEEEMSLTDRIMLERKRLAFFDPKKLFHGDGTPKAVHELDDDTAAAIAGLDVANIGNSEVGIGQVLKLKMADKNASLTALEKINGMYRDKDESEGVLNIIINM